MSKHTITFRLEGSRKKALESLAKNLDRDRSFVINEAIRTYLEINDWQLSRIAAGIEAADKEQFVDPEEELSKWEK